MAIDTQLTNRQLTNDKQLIAALIAASYESGYYSGKQEDGQPHHRGAIDLCKELKVEVLRRMKDVG